MNFFQAIAEIGRGATETALRGGFSSRRKRRRAQKSADDGGCTPCAAAAYVEGLQQSIDPLSGPPKRTRRGRRKR